jgi:hypothetical protein
MLATTSNEDAAAMQYTHVALHSTVHRPLCLIVSNNAIAQTPGDLRAHSRGQVVPCRMKVVFKQVVAVWTVEPALAHLVLQALHACTQDKSSVMCRRKVRQGVCSCYYDREALCALDSAPGQRHAFMPEACQASKGDW